MASEAQLISQKPVMPAKTAPVAAPKAAPQSAPGRYLSFSSQDLTAMISFVRANLATPHREKDGVSIRPLAAQAASAAQVTVPKLEVKALGNIGGAPEIDPEDARPAYEQETGNLLTIATLLTALRPDLGKQLVTLVQQAAQEESLLGKGAA